MADQESRLRRLYVIGYRLYVISYKFEVKRYKNKGSQMNQRNGSTQLLSYPMTGGSTGQTG